MLERAGVDLVLDAGASDGGFAFELRDAGYKGRIISFEPLQKPYRSLLAKARKSTTGRFFNMRWGVYRRRPR